MWNLALNSDLSNSEHFELQEDLENYYAPEMWWSKKPEKFAPIDTLHIN